MTGKRWDVFTLGEAMLRLSPPAAQRLEQAAEFRVYTGGSEANVAVGLARLGLRTAWTGKLPQNPLGMRVAAEIAMHGVDTSQVIWAKSGRVGVYYLEVAGAPRGSLVVYDRQGSAGSEMQPGDIDFSLLAEARHLHISGITPALSDACAATAREALAAARNFGATISFDINYRSRLWDAAKAHNILTPMLNVDLVFCTMADAQLVFGQTGAPAEVANSLRQTWGARMVVLTLGAEGALVAADGKTWHGHGLRVDPVDRVGAGDAYVAGFLYGYLAGDIDKAVAYGGAMAAWKYSEPGDFCWAREADIAAMLANEAKDIRR